MDLLPCADPLCSGHGLCKMVEGEAACECNLGYTGETCGETVNEALSVSLTVGVLVFILAFIGLAFLFAFIVQWKKARMRKEASEAHKALKTNGSYL